MDLKNFLSTSLFLCLLAGVSMGGLNAAPVYLASRTGDGAERIQSTIDVYHEILENMDQEETQNKPTPLSIPLVTSAKKTKDFETREFVEEIRFEIQESVEFPEELKGKGLNAIVVVEFELNPDGSLRTLKASIKRGEVLAQFEVGALKAVRKAVEFFPPVPEGMNTKAVRFRIPIIFKDV